MIFITVFLYLVGVSQGGPVESCPRGCVCEDAPLRSAPFVLTWMTSWGEDDLPEVHVNDATYAGDAVSSSTAQDAGVDVDAVGLHATCALMASSNLTQLMHALPPRTMVLSLMQAAADRLEVLETGQLAALTNLRALHIQGFATRDRRLVSGHMPNRMEDVLALNAHIRALDGDGPGLVLAVAEDALLPLTQLQVLDIQYARLVAGVEGARPRRQTGQVASSVASSTLLDVPLTHLLAATHDAGLVLPPDMPNTTAPPSQDPEVVVVPLEGGVEDVVPYDVFKAEHTAVLAPFRAQRRLKYLRVAHASLDRVGPELLTGLTELHTLTLEHNRVKVVPPAMFTPTPALRHLSLAHNNILELEAASFAGLEDLLTLDLDSNNIERLGPASLPYLPSLATIRLLDNPLTHLLPLTFANTNATETLLLGSRGVATTIYSDTFRRLDSLKTLALMNTSLISLSQALLQGMPALTNLTLHGTVNYIDYDAFTATPHLHALTLSHCHLHKLSLDAFFGLRDLRFLDLSHNNLEELSPGTFDHLSRLRELYLHHNNLTALPLGMFVATPVKLVQLQDNPWDCTCGLLQLRPALTNKVRRPGTPTCHWDEKLGTVCTTDHPPRLRYDSRVAPLCRSPQHFQGLPVHQVVHRRLKCPKNLWDPRPKPRKPRKPVKQAEKDEEGLVEEDVPNWLPLTAFSEVPKEVKDLLEIAEAEMPEEAFAPLTAEDMQEYGEEVEVVVVEEERPQLDESHTPEDLDSLRLTDYWRWKEIVKKQMLEDRRRAMQAKMKEKEQLKLRMAMEKRRIKAKMLVAEELERQRKMQELIELGRQGENEGMLLERVI